MDSLDISAEIRERVLQARAERVPVRVCGARSKPWMNRYGVEQCLQVGGHRGVVRHDPTELVVTARAGTPLAELDAILAERGQMLAAECPDFNAASTLGGALALGWSGSRAHWCGSLRDAVLGVRMVNGLGEILQFGGQVMKNVAGFDVSRLLSGSQGRLGVILELSLKLLPLPPPEMTRRIGFASLQEARRFVLGLLRAGEPVTGAVYHQGFLLLRVSGHGPTLARLAAALGGEGMDNSFWQDLRRLQLPFFAQSGERGELYDWNGALCWARTAGQSVQRRVGDAEPVALNRGPADAGAGPLAVLHDRLALAFDPAGVFQVARAV